MVNHKSVIFIHGNARPHVARVARITIRRLGWEPLHHPSYSLDLAPTDYRLFLRGKSFANEADLQQSLTDFFASKTADFYQQGIAQLKPRWQKVLNVDGDYFED